MTIMLVKIVHIRQFHTSDQRYSNPSEALLLKNHWQDGFKRKSPYYGVNTEWFLQTPVLQGKSRNTEPLTTLTHNPLRGQNTIMDNITKQLMYLDVYQDVQRFYIYTPSQIILLYLYILVDENKIEDQSVHKMLVY